MSEYETSRNWIVFVRVIETSACVTVFIRRVLVVFSLSFNWGSVEIFPLNPFGAANVTVGFRMIRKVCWEQSWECVIVHDDVSKDQDKDKSHKATYSLIVFKSKTRPFSNYTNYHNSKRQSHMKLSCKLYVATIKCYAMFRYETPHSGMLVAKPVWLHIGCIKQKLVSRWSVIRQWTCHLLSLHNQFLSWKI